MSITPVPVGPAARVAPAGAHGSHDNGADDAVGGTFAHLVASLLGAPGAPASGSPTATGGRCGEPGDGAADLDPAGGLSDEESGDALEESGALAGTQAPGSAAGLPVWLAALGVPATSALSAPVTGTTGEATAGVAAPVVAAPVVAATEATHEAVVGMAPSTVPPAAAPHDGPVADGEPRPAASPATAVKLAPRVGELARGSEGAVPWAAGPRDLGADPAPAAPTGLVTATAVAPVTTPTPTTEGARPAPVVSQVVPEVTRLVSRGDGVHRLTMRLQPEGLGDVRVTLTVRDGEVDVRLAAGDDARRALLEGAPELRRVLELAGATEARVLVRDLAGSTGPGGQQAWGQPGNQPGNQAGNQPGHHDSSPGTDGTGSGETSGRQTAGEQDQHARTRGGSAARDGHTDGATTPRPDPAGRALRGVDLTM